MISTSCVNKIRPYRYMPPLGHIEFRHQHLKFTKNYDSYDRKEWLTFLCHSTWHFTISFFTNKSNCIIPYCFLIVASPSWNNPPVRYLENIYSYSITQLNGSSPHLLSPSGRLQLSILSVSSEFGTDFYYRTCNMLLHPVVEILSCYIRNLNTRGWWGEILCE